MPWPASWRTSTAPRRWGVGGVGLFGPGGTEDPLGLLVGCFFFFVLRGWCVFFSFWGVWASCRVGDEKESR